MSAPHCPWKAPSAPAIVRFAGSSTRTIASRNWFHVQTERRIPSEATAGRASGTWMRQNSCQVVAPSTRAASDSSAGMVRKWARIQKTPKGM